MPDGGRCTKPPPGVAAVLPIRQLWGEVIYFARPLFLLLIGVRFDQWSRRIRTAALPPRLRIRVAAPVERLLRPASSRRAAVSVSLDCEMLASWGKGKQKRRPVWIALETSRLLPKHSLTYMVVIHDAMSNTRASHGMLSLVHEAWQWMHSAVHCPGGSMFSCASQQWMRMPGPTPSLL